MGGGYRKRAGPLISGRRVWRLVSVIGLVLIAPLAITLCLGSDRNDDIPRDVLEAIKAGDYEQARTLLAPHVEAGKGGARRLSGFLCVNFLAKRCDPAEAEVLLAEAAKAGDPEAQYALALALMRQGPSRADAARTWLEQAANSGHVVALFTLGKAGMAGDDPQAIKVGAKQLKKAAEAGLAPAQYLIGVAHETGSGVERSLEQAARWYGAAADLGHEMAQARLASLYELGQGLPRNGEEALRWYRLAARSGLTYAQYGLGMLLMTGELVSRDYYEGIHWLKKAAEADHAGAQEALGRAYRDGVGVARSPEKALEWFIRAGKQGHVIAQHHAGLLYTKNFYVRNYRAAADWFERAAVAGHGYSQIKIGDAFRFGQGRPKSLSMAQSWYGLATESEDHEVARIARKRMHSTAVDSLEVGLAMFGVGKRLPSFGEVFDAVIAGGIFEGTLYPNAGGSTDPDVQRAIDESVRANQEAIRRNNEMAENILPNL